MIDVLRLQRVQKQGGQATRENGARVSYIENEGETEDLLLKPFHLQYCLHKEK